MGKPEKFAKAKPENANANPGVKVTKAKSPMTNLLELHATSKAVTEAETGGFRVPKGYVMIRGRGNFCIKTGRNQRITQTRCSGKSNVMWRFVKYGGRYIIQNRNGYVLDNYAFKKNNGGPIYAWKRNNKNNQRWSIISLGRGKFELRGSHSGKCLDNTGKARNKQPYHQWSCSGGNANQHFQFLRSGRAKRAGRKGRSARKGGRKGRKAR